MNGMINILVDLEIFHSRVNMYIMSNVEVGMKCNINMLVLLLLVTYFCCTNVFQNLYSIHKNSMEASRLP
jgi:hypothetical protein